MLAYFLVTLTIVGVVVAGMAIGVILSNKELQGSCGGLGRLMGEDCSFCGKKNECEKNQGHINERSSEGEVNP